jgi:dTDP-4-dehydrorhamnose reductase
MNKSRPIVVLGPNGMLGQMVVAYFISFGYKVVSISDRFEEDSKWKILNNILKYPDAIVVNCIGRIKQKTTSEKELLWSNTILPLTLVRYLLPGQIIIHPSTDCVFDGLAGRPYLINDNTDAKDSYGWSKIMAEEVLIKRPNTLITRVSIVGPDKNPTAKGLMGWFFSNATASHVKGYTNHLWNGITTLEWCKQVEKILINDHLEKEHSAKLIQFSTKEYHSKYQMLCLFNEIYNKKYIIDPVEEKQTIDRRLIGQIICQPLSMQLQELKNNYNG